MNFSDSKINTSTYIDLYTSMLLPRMIEEKMLILLRQGKISKWFSGIGQEAISVGVAKALEKEEFIFPMHRNLGVFTSRDIPLHRLFSQWQGKNNGFTKGRDRSFHFGTKEFNIVGMISHLGPQMGVADGVALHNLIEKNKNITAVFTGEGGTSEGDFHEALNVASVWNLPVIFIIENNGYGLSTPVNEQYNCKNLSDRGIGYGIESLTLDGNNVIEVYSKIKEIRKKIIKKPQPFLIEFKTFRMRGHEEASGVKYVPKELLEKWGKKDPVLNFEAFLIDSSILTVEDVTKIKKGITKEIDTNLEKTFNEKKIISSVENELSDVYADFNFKKVEKSNEVQNMRLVDSISDGLKEAMYKNDSLIIMGQDIAEYGGVFKMTEGFLEKFGKDRVRNTPICESAIVSAALGLSINGYKAVVEMQFADFVTSGFNPIINNLAKTHYRWGENVDVVVRMPTGGGVSAGPFHSQSNEAWFFHTPGLKIVYPSCSADAKGLLNAAIEDPNPYLFFEHKALYRSHKEMVFDDYYTTEIGKAKLVHEGNDVTIVTYGMGVYWSKDAMKNLSNYSADIIDLRTLQPWDKEAVRKSVEKTNKIIVVHEDSITGGIGAEISAWVTENCFSHLDGPVMRVGGLDTPIPFRKELEDNFMPTGRIEEKINSLLKTI